MAATSDRLMNERDRLPRLRVPEPLRGTDRGSFAEYTVARRMPAIAERVLEENELDADTRRSVQSLVRELPDAPVRLLADPAAPDAEDWNRVVASVLGQSWLEVAWFFAETYFYRRIVEAVGYFASNGRRGTDPFRYQKRRGLEVSADQIDAAFDALEDMLSEGWRPDHVSRLLKADLWGNQADLSLWPADDKNHPTHAAEDADSHLLIDTSLDVARHLARRQPVNRVDVIADNAGFELIGDLVLADYLLTTGTAERVHLHVKLHPTFVSDATEEDVRATADVLGRASREATRAGGRRIAEHLTSRRLELRTHPFWTSALAGWEMPDEVHADLSNSALVVAKGDANYRRLLGDRHWPLDAPFTDIVSYLKVPLVALRTYKSEVGCGLQAHQVTALDAKEPDWRTNGRWGIIQSAHLSR